MRQLIYGYGNPRNHVASYRKIYLGHNKDVQKHFLGRANFLVIDIEESNDILAKRISDFLGLENNGASFPVHNIGQARKT